MCMMRQLHIQIINTYGEGRDIHFPSNEQLLPIPELPAPWFAVVWPNHSMMFGIVLGTRLSAELEQRREAQLSQCSKVTLRA